MAVEAALTPTLRLALEELCGLFGIAREGWQATPLQVVFETAAVLLVASRLVREGRGEKDAVSAAAERLGLPGDTIRTRVTRWFLWSRTKSHDEPRRNGDVAAS